MYAGGGSKNVDSKSFSFLRLQDAGIIFSVYIVQPDSREDRTWNERLRSFSIKKSKFRRSLKAYSKWKWGSTPVFSVVYISDDLRVPLAMTGKFFVRITKITSRICVSFSNNLCFRFFSLVNGFVKVRKSDNSESHNHLNYSFINIWDHLLNAKGFNYIIVANCLRERETTAWTRLYRWNSVTSYLCFILHSESYFFTLCISFLFIQFLMKFHRHGF